jgi:NAD(P)-dependent dehydrogenase (short-subunit alcohol dehydrogenase family)
MSGMLGKTIRDLGVPLPARRELDVAGKVVVITGGADGIGLGLARVLHGRGATVALVDVNGAALDGAEVSLGGQRVVTAKADVRDRAALDAAVREITERVGGIDVVVANAGVTPPPSTLRQIDATAFQRVIDINLMGVFNTVRATADEVIARRGHVVVVSSAAAFTPGLGGAAYMISKAGVEQLARALRLELACHGVTVGLAYFGFVDTGLARATLDDDPLGERLQSRLPTPLRRRISPERAATVIADGIERRAGSTMAPGAWQVWALLRGLVSALGDGYLAADPEVHTMTRELEDRSSAARTSRSAK